jgi:hypothetical protein
MKKLSILTAALLLAGSVTHAQFYVQGGANFANISTSNNGETQDNNTLTTFNVGVMSRFGLTKVFDIEAGLLLQGRGAKSETYFTSSNTDNYVKAKFNPYYIELPVNAVVKFPLSLSGKRNVFVHAGPYIAMGIGGKSKVESKILGTTSTSTETIKFNNDDPTTSGQEDAAYDRLKRFDFGANVGAGLDLGMLMFKVNYGIGFSKINSTETNNSDNDKNKYRTFSVSVGIPLGR